MAEEALIAPVVETTPTTTETPAVPVAVETKPALEQPEQKTVPIHRFNEVYRQRKELERENEALRRAQAPAVPETPPTISEPKMKDFGDENDPAAVKRFNEAWVDHRAELKLVQYKQEQERDRLNQTAEQRRREAGANLQQKLLEASTKNPDIYDAVSTFDRYGFHNEFSTVVAESAKSTELIAYLAENTGEALRLRNMPLSRSLHELGRIEGNLQTGKGSPVKPTQAAPPPVPVGVEHQTTDISRMSQKEYNKYMNDRMGNR